MKKIIIVVSIIIVVAGLVWFLSNKYLRGVPYSGQQSETYKNLFGHSDSDAKKYLESFEAKKPKSSIMSVELAEFIASDKLKNILYPNENYKNIGYLTLYDLGGKPSAYNFVYSKADSKINTLQDLNNALEKVKNMKMGQQRYLANEIAQVVIEAVNTAKNGALSSFSKGAPNSIVEKENLQKILNNDYSSLNLKLGRIIYPAYSLYYEAGPINENISSGNPVPDDWYLINISAFLRQKELKSVSSLREQIENSKIKKAQDMMLMKPKYRELFEQGEIERYNANIKKWEEYEQKFQSAKN